MIEARKHAADFAVLALTKNDLQPSAFALRLEPLDVACPDVAVAEPNALQDLLQVFFSGMAGDLDYCIGHAAAGDTVTFGVIGDMPTNVLQPGQDIHIEGPGADLLTLYPRSFEDPVVTVEEGASVSRDGLTIDGSSGGLYPPWLGGGICNYGTLTVSNCEAG